MPRVGGNERLALIRARTGINPILILIVPVAAIVYAYAASQAELIGQSGVAVAILAALAVLCLVGMMLRPTGDRLELFRVFSFYYLCAFCVAPLAEPAISLYVFDEPKAALLQRTAALALFAYVAIAIGYHLPLFRRPPERVIARHDLYSPEVATVLGLVLWAVGLVCFLALFVFAGGAAVILRGEGAVHRTEFAFGGLGYFYWASLFMLPGGAIYFAAQAARRGLLPWLHAWPLATAFGLLLLLQGRHRAIAPVLIAFGVSHYMVRRVSLSRLAVYGVIGVALAIVMSSARIPGLRGTFTRDPVRFTIAVLVDFPERLREVMSGDIGRIDEVMLVVDHVPDRMPYDYGWSLTIPLNPIRRVFFGVGSEAPMVGERLYFLSRPDMRNALYRTGFLPSVVGEVRANFPTWACFFPFLVFGLSLRLVYERLIVRHADFVSVAAYAILGLYLCNMVIGTFAQNFFEMLVVSVPVLVVRRLSRRGASRRPPEPDLDRDLTPIR
jgi:hypothetical protein